jgi:hypothetical protein
VYPRIDARQRLGKNVTTATNTHATIEELLDVSFYMRSVSYQRKIGDQSFPEFLVFLEKLTAPQLVKKSMPIMELEGSL